MSGSTSVLRLFGSLLFRSLFFLFLSLTLSTLAASHSLAQSVESYAYVHKKLVELTAPPWQCVCYSASRESVIMTHNSANQVWVVERYSSLAAAMAARDEFNTGPNVCGFCPGKSGSHLQIFIFQNCNSGRCEIGVADGNYSEPGWFITSAPFKSHPDAWREACKMHHSGRAYAPAIASGKINCRNMAQPSPGQCFNLTKQDKYGPHNGRTRCCNEKGGSRWWGPHYGAKYSETGKFYQSTCNAWLGIANSNDQGSSASGTGGNSGEQCFNLSRNDKYGPHNGRTRCCNEESGSRWWGPHYGAKYSASGKWYQRSCESWLGR